MGDGSSLFPEIRSESLKTPPDGWRSSAGVSFLTGNLYSHIQQWNFEGILYALSYLEMVFKEEVPISTESYHQLLSVLLMLLYPSIKCEAVISALHILVRISVVSPSSLISLIDSTFFPQLTDLIGMNSAAIITEMNNFLCNVANISQNFSEAVVNFVSPEYLLNCLRSDEAFVRITGAMLSKVICSITYDPAFVDFLILGIKDNLNDADVLIHLISSLSLLVGHTENIPTREITELLDTIGDDAVQKTLKCKIELLTLLDTANHFISNLLDIANEENNPARSRALSILGSIVESESDGVPQIADELQASSITWGLLNGKKDLQDSCIILIANFLGHAPWKYDQLIDTAVLDVFIERLELIDMEPEFGDYIIGCIGTVLHREVIAGKNDIAQYLLQQNLSQTLTSIADGKFCCSKSTMTNARELLNVFG